jgi:anthranilate/para-aminobenzoate synthase component II
MKKILIFNYDSRFCGDIERSIQEYNAMFPDKAFLVEVCRASGCPFESLAGPADVIIHSGGDGEPVIEDIKDVPRLYICHSHQWKAKKSGGNLLKLDRYITGVQAIDILDDDNILGKKGKMPIMKYHSLIVTKAPVAAKVLARAKILVDKNLVVDSIEALRYPDGSVSVQGHPEEGTAIHIIHNFLKMTEPQDLISSR